MTRALAIAIPMILAATAASGQSLFIRQGERAVDASAGWTVGPFSNGLEIEGAVSLDGRWDVGANITWSSADFGGDANTASTDFGPLVRYFFFKETDDGTPVSLAGEAQIVWSRFEGEGRAWDALVGAELFKSLTLHEAFALYPFVGFSVAGESYSLGGDDPDRSIFLTRRFGVHGQMTFGTGTWVRLTVQEHSWRRETFRAVRVALVRRF